MSIGQMHLSSGWLWAKMTLLVLALAGATGAGAQTSAAVSHHKLIGTSEYVAGELIVKLKGDGTSTDSQAFIGRAVSQKSMKLKGSWSSLNMHHFSLAPGADMQATLDELNGDSSVLYAEPNYIVRRQSIDEENSQEPVPYERTVASVSSATSDAGSGTVTEMSATSQTSAPIELQQAWSAMSSGKTPPVVAIIDTGLDLTHSVFVNSGAIWVNTKEIAKNGIDDDKNGYIDDVNGWNFVANTNSPLDDEGHGTHVSGIVLGTTQDIFATPIAAAQIRIMPLKFLDSTGSGSTSDAVNAIYYAVNNGAKVLNNSWGGGGFSNSLLDAITYAYNNKVIFVAAAGNSSSNNDSVPTYPANYTVPNIMSIAATSDTDGFASFSNFGASTVGVGSPGVNILSTYPGNTTYRMSGTSMSTPFVSGIAALMVREAPSMNGYQLRSLLYGAANGISALVSKTSTQARINVYSAVLASQGTSVSSAQPSYDAAAAQSTSSGSGSAPALGGCGLVARQMFKIGNGPGSGGASGVQNNVAFFGLLVTLLAPIFLSLVLRSRNGKNMRRHTRYQIDSQVRLRFGDRELVGHVSTISLGGVQLNTDAWLEKGGVVKMAIQSPDGKDQLEVEGKVVWSEEQKRYGVAFANADDSVIKSIRHWTRALLKA